MRENNLSNIFTFMYYMMTLTVLYYFLIKASRSVPAVKVGRWGRQCPQSLRERRENREVGTSTAGWEEGAAIMPEPLPHPSTELRPRSN